MFDGICSHLKNNNNNLYSILGLTTKIKDLFYKKKKENKTIKYINTKYRNFYIKK